jgi:hypothetical protein
MIWQDWTIAIGQFLFALALLPSIYSIEKPALWTCFMTASLLFVFGGVYFSLGLYIAVLSVLLCGAMWSVLLFQKRAPFRPTHQHAEGGVYQVLGYCEVHTADGAWEPAVVYIGKDGFKYVRTAENFNARFKPL